MSFTPPAWPPLLSRQGVIVSDTGITTDQAVNAKHRCPTAGPHSRSPWEFSSFALGRERHVNDSRVSYWKNWSEKKKGELKSGVTIEDLFLSMCLIFMYCEVSSVLYVIGSTIAKCEGAKMFHPDYPELVLPLTPENDLCPLSGVNWFLSCPPPFLNPITAIPEKMIKRKVVFLFAKRRIPRMQVARS